MNYTNECSPKDSVFSIIKKKLNGTQILGKGGKKKKTRLKDRLYEDATFVQAEKLKKKKFLEWEKTVITFRHQILL